MSLSVRRAFAVMSWMAVTAAPGAAQAPATLPFLEDFESGTLSNYWSSFSGSGGRIQVSQNFTPFSGAWHLLMDRSPQGSPALNELILHVVPAGFDNVTLSFQHKEFSDESHVLPNVFTNHAFGDGVALSVDGTNWFRAQGLTGSDGIGPDYTEFLVDLSALASANGLELGTNTQIKFQQYDNATLPTDGFAFDDIRVTGTARGVHFGAAMQLVGEGAGTAAVQVVRLQASGADVSVDYASSNGTAEAGTDYTAVAGTLIFTAGVTSIAVEIPISDDSDIEGDETLYLTLSNAVGSVVAEPANTQVLIVDDEGPGSLAFAAAALTVVETDGQTDVEVVRLGGTDGEVTVNYAAGPGSAAGGEDFVLTTGTLVFAEGETSAAFAVTILDDAARDPAETVLLALTGPMGGASLGVLSNATLTIADNEAFLFQGFEGSNEDSWNYAAVPNGASIDITATRSMSGSRSLRLTGAVSASFDPWIVFDNVDISALRNVAISVAFSAEGPDSSDDLYLDLSYDGGITWDGTGSVKLVDGFSNSSIPFGATSAFEPTTVATNPYTVLLPANATQVRLRLRFDATTGSSAIDDYFVDDIALSFIPAGQPPVLHMATAATAAVALTLNLEVTATELDGDLITLSATNLPAGAGFDAVTGVGVVTGALTFTPSVAQADQVLTSRFFAADTDGTSYFDLPILVIDKVISFASTDRLVEEDSGAHAVDVVLNRPLDASVRVALSGSASNGASHDYTISTTNLMFNESGPATQTLAVTLMDDPLPEHVEALELHLVDPVGVSVRDPERVAFTVRDNDSISLVAANLTSGGGQRYREEGGRILASLQPDVIAIQEFKVSDIDGPRAFIDDYIGTDYTYVVESDTLPNGIISRWPIVATGEWDDVTVSGRDFVWASIDLPGSRDLHIVSVHFYASGGPLPREEEARAITNFLAQAGFPTGDFIVVAGDFNSETRSEPALGVMTTMLSDAIQPADQRGTKETNADRDKPFDYILPNAVLDARHVPLPFGGQLFPEGLVFDTRLWTNPVPPPPALISDSGAPSMQHMAVMKLFALDSLFTITTLAGPHGGITPMNPAVSAGSAISFTITPDAYYGLTAVITNGIALADEVASNGMVHVWSNVTENGTLEAVFAAHLAFNATPHWWLASFGFTNEFDDAALDDFDGDGLGTWQEFITGSDPTLRESAFVLTAVNVGTDDAREIRWLSASNRTYTLSRSTNLVEGFSVIASGLTATPPVNSYTDQVDQADVILYRVTVQP